MTMRTAYCPKSRILWRLCKNGRCDLDGDSRFSIPRDGQDSQYTGGLIPLAIVPEYISKDNKDGTQSAVTIRHLAASAFGGNPSVENVMPEQLHPPASRTAPFKKLTYLRGISSLLGLHGAEAFAGSISGYVQGLKNSNVDRRAGLPSGGVPSK